MNCQPAITVRPGSEIVEVEDIPLNFDTGVKKLDMPNGKRLQRSPICDYVLNAYKVIALPKLKTHPARGKEKGHILNIKY